MLWLKTQLRFRKKAFWRTIKNTNANVDDPRNVYLYTYIFTYNIEINKFRKLINSKRFTNCNQMLIAIETSSYVTTFSLFVIHVIIEEKSIFEC